MSETDGTDLRSLRKHPFDLMLELEKRAKRALAGSAGEAGSDTEWVGIGFRLADELFIVAREEIREIMTVPDSITRVPGAKNWIRGLANARGHLVPVIDLKMFLGAGAGSDSREARVLVVSSEDLPVGIVVDEVFGFRRFLEREYRADAPETVARCDRYLHGSYERGQEVWPVFGMSRLLGSDEFRNTVE